MEAMNFDALLQKKTQEAEQIVLAHLPAVDGYQKTVLDAMHYSVEAGGKRLRPLMMKETFLIFGGDASGEKILEAFMSAMEMIHTYSLVHDDLPAMDNDRYRRGKETTWAVYGDAFGVLTGDALLNYAFEVVAKALEEVGSDTERSALLTRGVKAFRVLSDKAGIFGMIGGQVADVEAEKKDIALTEDRLVFIHTLKTAALIQASLMIGAILAGADETEVKKLEECGYCVGVAFQVQDDILDVIGDMQELGKPIGSDAINGKQTWVTLKGLEQAKEDVKKLSEEAMEIVEQFPGDKEFLRELIRRLISRRK